MMTIAAKQCREYLEDAHPGIGIGRKSCRDTSSGDVSQHSAYEAWQRGTASFDSNAMDLYAPTELSVDERMLWLDRVVDDLRNHAAEWSIRKVLWRIPNHFGHAHVDFYPMCTTHKWCGRAENPTWRYSDRTTIVTRNPEPENGRYEGEFVFITWANGMYDTMTDSEITALRMAGYWEAADGAPIEDADQYWRSLRDKGSEGRSAEQRAEVARFIQTCYTSSWIATPVA